MSNTSTRSSEWQAFCSSLLCHDLKNSTCQSITINDNTDFHHYLKSNGIECLILDALEKHDKTTLLPPTLIEKMQVSRRISSVNELYNKQNLGQTLKLLADNNIPCLILKGAALAYSLYSQPFHRIRGDTDLLVRPADKAAVDTLLRRHGYEKSVTVSGRLISHQTTYTSLAEHSRHHYDIHWKLSNRNAFADLFDFDTLYKARQAIPELGDHAFRLGNCGALLHAIVHYFGHYPDDRARLIWLYDFHLLCSQFNPDQWDAFLEDSNRKKLDPLVLRAILKTQSTFNTNLPSHILETLKQSPIKLNKIEQRRLDANHWSRFEQFRSDWAALGGLQRCQLIKEYLLPPTEFILAQNNSENKLLLPYFYCKRLLIGGLKVLKNPHN